MILYIIDSDKNYDDAIQKSVEALSNSELVCFPTETVYGVGADIFNINAVSKIFEIKNRPWSKPLAAHVSSIEMIEGITENIPDMFYELAEKFLPGPLSIVLNKNNSVSDLVTSNTNTIAIRYPDSAITLEIINTFKKPIAATSANISGSKSAKNAIDAYRSLKGLIPLIIDSGTCKYGVESTVLSLIGEKPVILREGKIKKEELWPFLDRNIR